MYIKYISAMVHLSEMSDDVTLAVNVEFLLRENNHNTELSHDDKLSKRSSAEQFLSPNRQCTAWKAAHMHTQRNMERNMAQRASQGTIPFSQIKAPEPYGPW